MLVCMCAHSLLACLVLTETRRCQIPLHWIMNHCKLSQCWELNLSTLQKQLLNALNHLSQLLCMVRVSLHTHTHTP